MAQSNRVPFAYTTPVIASLPSGSSQSVVITFDQDSDFDWHSAVYFVDLASAAITDGARPIPLITINMVDTGSGRQLINSPIPIDAIGGYKSSEPFKLPINRNFQPNATLRFTFSNYSASTTYTNLYYVLHGTKTFK